ncbi:hypothetical protein DsansV1_C04g0036571 [Dioscorea sansibarensis]
MSFVCTIRIPTDKLGLHWNKRSIAGAAHLKYSSSLCPLDREFSSQIAALLDPPSPQSIQTKFDFPHTQETVT